MMRVMSLAPVSAALITVCALTMAKLKASFTILLADRLLPGAGWGQIALFAIYAAFLTNMLLKTSHTQKIRIRIWLLFSIVFFGQFLIGILGADKFLMSGRLHVPVPVTVIGGPIFRGARFFMPILFLSTVVIVGPAWCSFLCYFGAWDGLAARHKKQAKSKARYWRFIRIALFALTPITAIVLRILGMPGEYAALFAVGFGVAGALVMVLFSTKNGVMVHCTSFCPLGLLSNILGKISPFRIKINNQCSECYRCSFVCRYSALEKHNIQNRKPGGTCTLCGDCLSTCRDSALSYAFLRLSSKKARTLFTVLIVSLHAVFLSIARI